MLRAGTAYRWTNDGYAPPQRLDHVDGILTPPTTVQVLEAGYRPAFHPTTETVRDKL